MQIWIATNKRDVPRVMNTKLPPSDMVFDVFSSEGYIMPPHIFESQHQSVPGCAEKCGDPTRPKTPRLGFRRSATTLYPSLTAPSSPDLNPLVYFAWSYVENITNMTSYNTKANLIAAIHRVFAELPPALVEKACSQFRTRIEAVIEAEGGYIE